MLTYLDGLPFAEGQRYWTHAPDEETCCWPDLTGRYPRLKLATIRRSQLPMIEDQGVLGEPNLADSAGLAEAVHVVFFDEGIVGVEFNFYGPRVARLRDYFAARARSVCPPVEFEPLLRDDALQQLQSLRSVRLMRLRARPSFAAELKRNHNSLGEAFEATANFSGGAMIEIVARVEPNSRKDSLLPNVKETALALYHAARKSVTDRSEVAAFEVDGYDAITGKLQQIDLLSDQLVSSQSFKIMEGRTRAIVSSAAYEAIERAHEEVAPQLQAAASLEP